MLVLSGTVGAQIVLILGIPVISRVYAPADYGIYAYLTSISLIIANIANLRLDAAIPLPRSNDTASDLVWLATLSAGIISLLVAVALAVAADQIPPDNVLSSEWAWTLPPMVFITAHFTLWNQVALREQLYTVVARRPIMQNAGTVSLQLALVPFRLGAGGLVLGQLTARALTTAATMWSSRALWRRTTPARMRHSLSRYLRFPLVIAPSTILNTLGLYIPLLFTTHFYGKEAGGVVALAQQLVLLPAATVGAAVGQVYVAQLAHSIRENSIGSLRTFVRATLLLATCALIFAILLAILGPVLLPAALGGDWAATAPFSIALSVASTFGLVASPLSTVLIVTERSRTTFLLDLLRVLLVGGAGLIAVRVDASALHAVLAMSVAQAAVYSLTWLTSMLALRSPNHG